ncbi:hypothetical protein ACQ4PT_055316 [Festuca glaucescens]
MGRGRCRKPHASEQTPLPPAPNTPAGQPGTGIPKRRTTTCRQAHQRPGPTPAVALPAQPPGPDTDEENLGPPPRRTLPNLGLEEVGVKMDNKGAIVVDEYSRTSVDSIWAVGDVTDRINLTPVALMEGGAFAKTAFGDEPTKPDHSAVPAAVFSQPPIGQVGLTEEQAIEEYGDVDVYISNFRPLRATLSGLPDRVLMKLIVCATTNKVVGVHMCGDDAPEIIQGIAIAVKAGLTKQDFDATVGVHPTSAEEFVTMRSPTRKVRREAAAEVESKDEVVTKQ